MRFDSREEVIRFEDSITAYENQMNGFNFNSLSLISAYDFCRDREDGGKLFTSYLDLYLNVLLLALDMVSAGAAWNKFLGKGVDNTSIYEEFETFIGKTEVFRFNSSFILRYRAFLDKFMGLLILYHVPGRYEAFNKGKSRRGRFVKALAEIQEIPQDFCENIVSHIDAFDREYRTAEAHGTGSLRKRSFSMLPLVDDPSVKLLKQYNMLIILIDLVNKLFAYNKN